ncbi:MAG: globin [Thermoanaerobaculia bacterium]|nr:globin [Thermoanaerobaculia bacterium]
MTPLALAVFEASLKRCEARRDFLDVFYENFLASAPEVSEKFAHTDFARQKEALRASFHHLLLVARDPKQGPDPYLEEVAVRHGAGHLAIGAHLYDLWLDSLLDTVRACDPECLPGVEAAWEEVMMVGIHYLCANYEGRHRG